VSIN